jgi:hypothetical protein
MFVPSCSCMRFRLPKFDEVMTSQVCEKFLKVTDYGGAVGVEFARDLVGDLSFREPGAEKFEDPGTDKIETEHLSFANVENDGTVLAMR